MANRFWVGGSGTWNTTNTANWSATSGGASGASVPISTDNATFDSNSGSGTCVMDTGATCSALTIDTASLTIQLGANVSITTVAFNRGLFDLNNFSIQTQIFQSVQANARTLAFGASGKVQITRTSTVSFAFDTHNATNTIVYTGTPLLEMIGNFLSGVTIGIRGNTSSANPISVNVKAGSGSLNIGSGFSWGNIDFTGFSGTWLLVGLNVFGDLKLSPTMTTSFFTAGAISMLKSSGTQKITSNSITIDQAITINSSNVTVECQDALTLGATRTLTLTNGTLLLKNGATSTVGAFATSGASQKFLRSTTLGSVATLSQASGTVSASNLTITDIAATGGATWNAFTTSGNVDGGNNSGWDFSSQLGKFMYARRKNKRILP